MNVQLSNFLQVMITPIVRFCLKNSLGIHELVEAAKVVFMRVAEEEMEKSGKKVTISRLSVATGVHRKDAARIYKIGELEPSSGRLSGKIIQQWRRDRRFLTENNRPRVLEYKGDNSEFQRLVETVSTDLKPGTVLFDLERIGAIERTSNGVKLIAKAYVPRGNPQEGFRMLASDTEDLIEAVTTNIYSEAPELPNYHAKAVYDNVSPEDAKKIRDWFFKHCSNFHQKVMRHLSKFDLDMNPNPNKKGGVRVALGMFSRIHQGEE